MSYQVNIAMRSYRTGLAPHQKGNIMKEMSDQIKTPDLKKQRTKPSNNLRTVKISTLIEIRENGYESKSYKGHFYDREEVEKEIARKMASKKWRGDGVCN